MRGLAYIALLVLGTGLPVAAEDDRAPGRLSLDEAMKGATAMTLLDGGILFIARADGGYLCGVNVSSKFFAGLLVSPETAFSHQPSALCITARAVEDLGLETGEKL